MSYCNNYEWNPCQTHSTYDEDPFISAPKCVNLPKNISLCYNPGLKPTATLSVGGHTIATGVVNLLTKSVTLKGQIRDYSANVTLKLTDPKEFCGNVSGSVCKSSKCKQFNLQGICLK